MSRFQRRIVKKWKYFWFSCTMKHKVFLFLKSIRFQSLKKWFLQTLRKDWMSTQTLQSKKTFFKESDPVEMCQSFKCKWLLSSPIIGVCTLELFKTKAKKNALGWSNGHLRIYCARSQWVIWVTDAYVRGFCQKLSFASDGKLIEIKLTIFS